MSKHAHAVRAGLSASCTTRCKSSRASRYNRLRVVATWGPDRTLRQTQLGRSELMHGLGVVLQFRIGVEIGPRQGKVGQVPSDQRGVSLNLGKDGDMTG